MQSDKAPHAKMSQLDDLAQLLILNEAYDELEDDAEEESESDEDTKRIWAKDWLQKRDQPDG